MLTIYGISNCDSIKKACSFFKEHCIEYEFVDFKTSPVGAEKIFQWAQKSDISVLLNAKSTTYRALKLKELALNSDEKVEWMTKDNRLIKRPVIEYNSNLIIGFNQSQYEGIFLS